MVYLGSRHFNANDKDWKEQERLLLDCKQMKNIILQKAGKELVELAHSCTWKDKEISLLKNTGYGIIAQIISGHRKEFDITENFMQQLQGSFPNHILSDIRFFDYMMSCEIC